MKELTPQVIDTKQTAAEERQVQRQTKVQSIKKMPGHRTWELNLDTKLIREADVDTSVDMATGARKNKVVMKPFCIYCTALNAKNADKRFAKMLAMHAVLQKFKAI